jgi:glyoxylase-like metal-dependent hydrolase (beta-lactamase superfamily II)
MIFRQVTHDDLGCASYLIGDEDAGIAAVIDPKLEIDEYLRLARYFGVRIEQLHTPGHRPEHTAFALTDTARGPEPWAVLSGDTLFVGDIARPDLAVDKRESAQGIFHSLRDTLLELPDDCEVWPGHLGGSLCGGPGMDMKVASTIGYERRHHWSSTCAPSCSSMRHISRARCA